MELQWKNPNLIIQHSQWSCTNEMFTYFHISKKQVSSYYQKSLIQINHKGVKENTILHNKDTICIHTIIEAQDESCIACYDSLHILYEDDVFLIVDKASGMLVHSDGVSHQTTLYDLVKGYYTIHGILCPVRAIHRLDKETTGAVIFCKIPFLQPLLDAMLKEKRIERTYIALCAGKLSQKKFSLEAPIGRDRHHASRMRIAKNGKSAKTNFTILKSYANYTCLKCQLQQGRTHQIRVHLSSIQHPILHDVLYGNTDTRISRCALHAYQVVLFHPILQKEICIECPLPSDIKSLLL